MKIDYAALADEVNPQFRVRAAKLAEVMTNIDHRQHEQASWAKLGYTDGHVCGTPQCALGWAIHSGLAEGVELGVLCNLGDLNCNAEITVEDEYDDTIARLDTLPEEAYKAISTSALNYAYVLPIRGDRALEWDTAGIEYFGAAIMEGVFGDGTLSKSEVVAKLTCYAEHGYVIDEDGDNKLFVADRRHTVALEHKGAHEQDGQSNPVLFCEAL